MADGSGTAQQASGAAGTFERAHAALLNQSDIQFTFHAIVPPPTPAWLKAFGHWLAGVTHWAAPAFKYIFWIGVAVGVCAIVYFLVWELVAMRLGWRKPSRVRVVELESDWKPTVAKARTLLEDADRLAAEGRFEEAVHLLLFRSIEDIDARWPNTVKPALTSRDIADHPRLSDKARGTFTGIAQVVERSFFGGADVGAGDFRACRDAYADFALAGAGPP